MAVKKKLVKDLQPLDWIRVGVDSYQDGKVDQSLRIHAIIDLPDYPLRCIIFNQVNIGFPSITLPMDDEIYVYEP